METLKEFFQSQAESSSQLLSNVYRTHFLVAADGLVEDNAKALEAFYLRYCLELFLTILGSPFPLFAKLGNTHSRQLKAVGQHLYPALIGQLLDVGMQLHSGQALACYRPIISLVNLAHLQGSRTGPAFYAMADPSI